MVYLVVDGQGGTEKVPGCNIAQIRCNIPRHTFLGHQDLRERGRRPANIDKHVRGITLKSTTTATVVVAVANAIAVTSQDGSTCSRRCRRVGCCASRKRRRTTLDAVALVHQRTLADRRYRVRCLEFGSRGVA